MSASHRDRRERRRTLYSPGGPEDFHAVFPPSSLSEEKYSTMLPPALNGHSAGLNDFINWWQIDLGLDSGGPFAVLWRESSYI